MSNKINQISSQFIKFYHKYYYKYLNHVKYKNEISNLLEMKGEKRILKSTPYKMLIDSTNKCNCNCTICYRRYNKLTLTDLSQNNFDNLKSFINRTTRVDFTGSGEAFLNKNLLRMVSFMKNHGVIIGMTTNGTLLKKNVDIIKYIDYLVISFDGGTKKNFEEIRVGANFDEIIDTVKNLNSLDLNTEFYLRCTICKQNFKEMSLILKIAKDINIKNVQFSNTILMHEKMKPMILDENDELQLKQIIEETAKLATEYGISCTFTSNICSTNTLSTSNIEPNPIYCTAPWRMINVRSDGKIFACCNPGTKSMGDLNESSIEEIWNNQSYQSLRASMVGLKDLNENCKNCNDSLRFE